MNKFQNGKVYIIRSPHTNMIYIGSTTQMLCKRMSVHRSKYKTKTNKCSSIKILECCDAYIELIEEYPCNSKEQLNAREGHHQRTTLNCINKNIAGRTVKQYYQDNSEKLKEQKKQYYQDNAEKLKEKHSCVCGGRYTTKHKLHHEKTLMHQTYIHQMNSTK